jgi:hypothetical protein
MKQRTTKNQCVASLLFIAVLLLTVTPKSISAQVQVNSINNYKMPSNWKKYYEDKYKNLDDISSTIQERPQGPLGSLHLRGHFKVKIVDSPSGDRKDRARSIAQAFLRDEQDVFGLRDLSELREDDIRTSQGHDGEFVDVQYRRYIGNMPVDKSAVNITIGPDETIWFVDASLIPSPFELYEAASKKLITREEAINIAEQDMSPMAIDPKAKTIANVDGYVTYKSPYFKWNITTGKDRGLAYVIDGVNGEILDKKPRINRPTDWEPSPSKSDSKNQSAADTSTPTLGFGPVYIGEKQWYRIPLLSIGAPPLTFESAIIVGDKDFIIQQGEDGCSGQSLEYQQTCTIKVMFIPEIAGPRQAILKVPSNGGTKLVNLKGVGVIRPPAK